MVLLFSYLLLLCAGNSLVAADFPLNATYKVDTVWATAYQATVTLKNTSTQPTSSWTASFSIPLNYTLSTHFSNGVFTTSGQNVTVKNLSGNGVIPAGGSTTFNMIINMPRSAATVINNLQAFANQTSPPTPTAPTSPVLNTIVATTNQSYTVSWNSVANATSYLLQQDITINFSAPKTVAEGNITSMTFSNQPSGTYYYRVIAKNSVGNSPYSNVKNITVTVPTPPVTPSAPVLNSIQMTSSGNYTVSWNSVANATSYLLQQDTTINFSNPQLVVEGNLLSKSFSNQANGTYFYRVIAKNTAGNSPYSNVQNITVSTTPPDPTKFAIENSVWYITWTDWFYGPTFKIPANVNMINVFVGKLDFGTDGKPTINGFGNLNPPQLDAFTAYCAALQPPIPVKVSLGGGGGSYDRCWDLLTSANVKAFAQGIADYCHAHKLVGVDFDYEVSGSTEQQTLVGQLIKEFKSIDPTFQTSICTNAGFGPNYPWQQIVKHIFDAAMIAPGNCAVDRLYIMSYYNPIEDEKNWVLGWADWVETNYGFTPARVSVGIDDFDAHAYDPAVFKSWAAMMGYSTGHWAFDPARN